MFLAFALAYLFGVVFDATPSGAVTVPLAIAGLGATCPRPCWSSSAASSPRFHLTTSSSPRGHH